MGLDFSISQFSGLNTATKDIKKIPTGASPDALNWITGKYGDHIELRRGSARLGTTEQTGNGKITGLGVGLKYDGSQVPFYSHGQKVKYYNVTTDDCVEIYSPSGVQNVLASPTADGNDATVGSIAWSNPGNILAHDGSRASSVVAGDLVVADSYSESNYDVNLLSGLGGGLNSYEGQIFTNTLPGLLTQCKFQLEKISTPTGNINARVYTVSGGVPTGAPLATSDNVDITTISGIHALYTFTFSGANAITLAANTQYAVVLYNVNNLLIVGGDSTSPTASGTRVYSVSDGVTWVADATTDVIFYVYTTLPGTSKYLTASNFGFAIPAGATITGVKVEVEQRCTVGTISENSIKLMKAGVISGTEKSTGAILPASDAYTIYGGSSDVWGLSLTPDDVNATTFGVGFSVTGLGTLTAEVNHIRVTVYYQNSLLPTAASGEDVWFRRYQNLAGSFMYLGSPNSSIYKVPVANPGSAVDQAMASYRFGVFHIGLGRSFAGQRNGTTAGNNDKTGLFLSYIDKALLSLFTQVTSEAYGTGDGVTKTFTHTLSTVSGVKTAMYVSVTDTVESFIDDRNGNMVGSLGGTGTVNYATGAVSVTFATAPTNSQAITCGYYTESATSTGILDFSGSTNGQGKSFRQDDGGGNIMAIFNLNNIEYCFHLLKTWQFTATLDDTQSTNLPYRLVGIPYPRAAYEAPEGILFADLSRPTEPKFRRLQVLQGTTSTTIEPLSISDALDISGHAFDYCVAFRWGDYEIFCVQEKINGTAKSFNSIMYVRSVVSGAWDKLTYNASCLAEYNGTLLAGDSISNNLMTLFSGYDELGDVIPNYWTSGNLDIAVIPHRRSFRQLPSLKTVRRMTVDGLIQKDQSFKISLSYDSGAFTDVYTVLGTGSYVDAGIDTDIGQPTVGTKVIGDGGSSTAHPFEVDFPVNSDKFEFVRVRVEALGIGYVQVNTIKFRDIRDKGIKKTPARTV